MTATLNWSTNTFPDDELDAALRWAAGMGVSVELGPRHAKAVAESLRRNASWTPPAGVRIASLHAWTDLVGLSDVAPLAERLLAKMGMVHSAQENGVGDLDGSGPRPHFPAHPEPCPKMGTGTHFGIGKSGEIGARSHFPRVLVVHCRHEALVADFAACVSEARRWSAWCNECGIRLGLENSSRQPLEPFVRLFEAVPDLRLTLDVKHAYKPETLGLTYIDYLKPLGDRAVNFHVSGVDRSRDELGDGTPPGRDHIDWDILAADLARRRYSGLITVELAIDRSLPAASLEAAYRDLPAPAGSIAERLAYYGVTFFRERFAPVLA